MIQASPVADKSSLSRRSGTVNGPNSFRDLFHIESHGVACGRDPGVDYAIFLTRKMARPVLPTPSGGWWSAVQIEFDDLEGGCAAKLAERFFTKTRAVPQLLLRPP
jgi:hypothetical protein